MVPADDCPDPEGHGECDECASILPLESLWRERPTRVERTPVGERGEATGATVSTYRVSFRDVLNLIEDLEAEGWSEAAHSARLRLQPLEPEWEDDRLPLTPFGSGVYDLHTRLDRLVVTRDAVALTSPDGASLTITRDESHGVRVLFQGFNATFIPNEEADHA